MSLDLETAPASAESTSSVNGAHEQLGAQGMSDPLTDPLAGGDETVQLAESAPSSASAAAPPAPKGRARG